MWGGPGRREDYQDLWRVQFSAKHVHPLHTQSHQLVPTNRRIPSLYFER